MKTNSQQGSLVRFKLSSKQFPLPTQFRPSPMTHYLFQSNAITTAVQTDMRGYLMHLRNQNQRSQTGKQSSLWPCLLTFRCQPTISTPSSTVPSVPWRLLSLSLSQHSSTYTARQIIMLQASISRSPVSANIRQAPLFLHTTEPQVFNYSRLITKNVATKPRSLTLQVLMPTFLFPTTISRHDARLSSTTHCAFHASRINYNLTNLSRCNSFS